jgi:site-specific recombinase XerD
MPFCLLPIVVERIPQPLPESLLFRWWESNRDRSSWRCGTRAHLRGTRMLYQEHGEPLTEKVVQTLLLRAAKRAGVLNNRPHVLRHTFCSHLAMRGGPAIQELAGH